MAQGVPAESRWIAIEFSTRREELAETNQSFNDFLWDRDMLEVRGGGVNEKKGSERKEKWRDSST